MTQFDSLRMFKSCVRFHSSRALTYSTVTSLYTSGRSAVGSRHAQQHMKEMRISRLLLSSKIQIQIQNVMTLMSSLFQAQLLQCRSKQAILDPLPSLRRRWDKSGQSAPQTPPTTRHFFGFEDSFPRKENSGPLGAEAPRKPLRPVPPRFSEHTTPDG